MKIILAVLVSFMTCGLVSAQSCSATRIVSHNNQAQVINQFPITHTTVLSEVYVPTVAIAVPVLVPTFAFQYSPPCAMPAPQAPASGISVGIADDKERIKLLARALLEEMKRDAEQGGDGGPPIANDVGTPTPVATGGKTFLSILQNKCAVCHTGVSSAGGFAIFNSPGVYNLRADSTRMMRAIDEGRMPKISPDPAKHVDPLTEDEKRIIKSSIQ